MDMRKWLYSYRLGQVRQQLGFVAPLAAGEYGEVSQWLPAAALLHDVGKAGGRVPFWTRPVIVLGKKLVPGLLKRLVVYPGVQYTQSLPGWRRALSYAWYHAEVGAELAAAAGLSQRAVLYIRTHHQADGPAAELHKIDEVS